MPKKLKVVYCGTPEFSVPTLEALAVHPLVELVMVASMPDRPAGRGQNLARPPVAEWAHKHSIPLIQSTNVNKELAFIDAIKDVDVIIVLAFAQFLGSKVLNSPKLGCFNIHTSLLPRHRGAAPIQYAILCGDKITGVSIQKMVKKMDAGDVARSDEVTIAPNETGQSLHDLLMQKAAESCKQFINDLYSGNVKYVQQDESQVTFAPTLKKEDGLLDFRNKTFEELDRQVRALFPWPGTYCYLDNKRLKVNEISKAFGKLAPGQWSFDQGAFLIGHKNGVLRATQIQLEGKKACTDIEFINGMANSNPSFTINPPRSEGA